MKDLNINLVTAEPDRRERSNLLSNMGRIKAVALVVGSCLKKPKGKQNKQKTYFGNMTLEMSEWSLMAEPMKTIYTA